MISYRTVAAKIKAEAPGLASHPDAAIALFASQTYPDKFPKDQIDWTDHSAQDHPTVNPDTARQQSNQAAQTVSRTGLLGMMGGDSGGGPDTSSGFNEKIGVSADDFYKWAKTNGQSSQGATDSTATVTKNPNMMSNDQAASAVKDTGILPDARQAVLDGMGGMGQ